LEELQQLIHECANRERLAQEKLYRKFYPPLFLLCKRFFSTDHEALECLNDAMLKVYNKIAGFKPEQGEFFNWLYTIVRNTALDKVRLKSPATTEQIDDNMDFAYQQNLFDALAWKDVYKLLDVLPPATRVVCTLYYIEGFKIKEITEQLELSAGTVKWHLSEARVKLKPVLKSHYF
jgi:RNA polymerase sigma factor (sigma-70 family)